MLRGVTSLCHGRLTKCCHVPPPVGDKLVRIVYVLYGRPEDAPEDEVHGCQGLVAEESSWGEKA